LPPPKTNGHEVTGNRDEEIEAHTSTGREENGQYAGTARVVD
jgi:hypothetical protein